jgi:hypothetical protein
MVYIELHGNKEEQCTINLYNPLGQHVRTLYSGKTSSLSEGFSTNQLHTGLYYIRVDFGNNSRGYKLLTVK